MWTPDDVSTVPWIVRFLALGFILASMLAYSFMQDIKRRAEEDRQRKEAV